MSEHTDREPTPAEIEAGRDALRELGPIEPLADDVVARLSARLEREPGLAAPVRRARRRRPRLAFALPAFGAALAAAVAIVVIAQGGSSAPPSQVALSQVAKAAPTFRAKATTGTSVASDSSAAVALVPVPTLVGRSLADARGLARTSGLRLVRTGSACPSDTQPHVARQNPRPGAHVAPGSRVRIEIGTC